MSHPLDDDFQALTGRKLSDAPASSSAADEAGSSSSDDDTADEAEPLEDKPVDLMLADGRVPFLASATFAGRADGYVFTRREQGNGYYLDDAELAAAWVVKVRIRTAQLQRLKDEEDAALAAFRTRKAVESEEKEEEEEEKRATKRAGFFGSNALTGVLKAGAEAKRPSKFARFVVAKKKAEAPPPPVAATVDSLLGAYGSGSDSSDSDSDPGSGQTPADDVAAAAAAALPEGFFD